MSLTQDDLDKIKAVVDSRADLQDIKFERRFDMLEGRMDRFEDRVDDVQERMATKEQVEKMKTMLEGDHRGLVEDVKKLTALPRRVAVLEAKLAK